MHPEYEGGWTDFPKNIKALAGHLDAKVRVEQEKRDRVESGPNHPDLKLQELAHMDGALGSLKLKARAASEGKLIWDPRDVSGASSVHQTWVTMARKAGALETPDTYEPSLHASKEEHASPLRVIRGGNGANDLGSPQINAR